MIEAEFKALCAIREQLLALGLVAALELLEAGDEDGAEALLRKELEVCAPQVRRKVALDNGGFEWENVE